MTQKGVTFESNGTTAREAEPIAVADDSEADPVAVAQRGLEYADLLLEDEDIFSKTARAAFDRADKDKSGALDMQEASDCITDICRHFQINAEAPRERREKIFKLCDTSRDGALQRDEFDKFYRKVLESLKKKLIEQFEEASKIGSGAANLSSRAAATEPPGVAPVSSTKDSRKVTLPESAPGVSPPQVAITVSTDSGTTLNSTTSFVVAAAVAACDKSAFCSAVSDVAGGISNDVAGTMDSFFSPGKEGAAAFEGLKVCNSEFKTIKDAKQGFVDRAKTLPDYNFRVAETIFIYLCGTFNAVFITYNFASRPARDSSQHMNFSTIFALTAECVGFWLMFAFFMLFSVRAFLGRHDYQILAIGTLSNVSTFSLFKVIDHMNPGTLIRIHYFLQQMMKSDADTEAVRSWFNKRVILAYLTVLVLYAGGFYSVLVKLESVGSLLASTELKDMSSAQLIKFFGLFNQIAGAGPKQSFCLGVTFFVFGGDDGQLSAAEMNALQAWFFGRREALGQTDFGFPKTKLGRLNALWRKVVMITTLSERDLAASMLEKSLEEGSKGDRAVIEVRTFKRTQTKVRLDLNILLEDYKAKDRSPSITPTKTGSFSGLAIDQVSTDADNHGGD